jgi:hypothetical protein
MTLWLLRRWVVGGRNMRSAGVVFGLVLLTGVASAQAPAPKPAAPKAAAAKAAPAKPTVDMLELMRGIVFPNSNILFDTQQVDPGKPVAEGKQDPNAPPSVKFGNMYPGWLKAENAAASLDEVVDLLMKPGRSCSNGKPVPIADPVYKKAAGDLRKAADIALKYSKEKNQEKVSDATNDLADACSTCHEKFRDKGPAGSPARCTP